MSGAAGVGNRFVAPLQQIVDPAGVPYVGAQAFFYATGTATFQNTYADVGLTVPNANPVLTNSAGMWPNIFMVPAPAYRVRVLDPAGGIIYDCDPVGPASGLVPGSVPIGGIIPFGGGSPPSGWLLCDGAEVSRTVFAPLFATIGVTFGSGDGATTFNLPDMRGMVAVGLDTMGGIAANRVTSGGSGVDGATLGAQGGNQLLTAHNHPLSDPGHGHYDEGHQHYLTPDFNDLISYPAAGGTLSGGGNFAFSFPYYTQTASAQAVITNNATGIVISNAGGGNSQNVQPSLILNYIIFVG